MTDCGEEAPHLTVLPFTKLDDQVRFSRRRLAKSDATRPHSADPLRGRQVRKSLLSHSSPHGHGVDSRHGIRGISDPRGEAGVACEQKQPARGEIEASDRDESARGVAHDIKHRRPPVRIAAGRHRSARLVQQDRAPLRPLARPPPRQPVTRMRSGTTGASGSLTVRLLTRTRPAAMAAVASERDRIPSFDRARFRGVVPGVTSARPARRDLPALPLHDRRVSCGSWPL